MKSAGERRPTPATVFEAHRRILPFIHRTPLLASRNKEGLYFKMECWQRTGSFKVRGALNALFQQRAVSTSTVVTASAGNHGLGVTFAARMLGLKARVFVPETVVPAKRDALELLGAEVVIQGGDYDDAEAAAEAYARDADLTFIHAFADAAVIAGQGTVGLEIFQDLPQVRQVIVPVGGGGLIGGIALLVKHIAPHVEIIGVQPEASPAMWRALKEGRVVDTPVGETLADGLAGRLVHPITLELAQRYVDAVVLVSEVALREAMQRLWQEEKVVVEGSGAAGLAALYEQRLALKPPCVLVLSGSNTSLPLEFFAGFSS